MYFTQLMQLLVYLTTNSNLDTFFEDVIVYRIELLSPRLSEFHTHLQSIYALYLFYY